jgi:hypothetical protein
MQDAKLRGCAWFFGNSGGIGNMLPNRATISEWQAPSRTVGNSLGQLPLGIVGTGPVLGPPAFISVPESPGAAVGVLEAGEGVLGAGDDALEAGGDGVFGAGEGLREELEDGLGLGVVVLLSGTSTGVSSLSTLSSYSNVSHAMPSRSLSSTSTSSGFSLRYT